MTLPNTLRVVAPDGTQLLSLGVDSNFILEQLDAGFAAPRDVAVALPGSDGETDVTAFTGPRTVTAQVLVRAVNIGPAIDMLLAVMHPGLRNYLYVGRADWASERRIVARGASFACPPGSIRRAQMGFRCPAGTFEDTVSQTLYVGAGGGGTGGMSFPVSFPMSFGSGSVSGATSVRTSGTAPAPARWRLYGPFTSPVVTRTDTGQQLSFPGLTVAAGDYLSIDTGARTALINDLPGNSVLGQLDFPTASWWWFPAAATTPVLFTANATSTATLGVLTVRNYYL